MYLNTDEKEALKNFTCMLGKKKKIKNSQSIKYHISLMVYPSKKIHRPKNKKIKDFYWENST